MNIELITAIVFYAIIGVVIYKNRKKMQIIDKLFFVFKSEKAINFIKKVAKPKWFWRIVSTISIPICLYFMIFGIHALASNAIEMFNTPDPSAGVSLLIPGIKLPGSELYVPFWYGIISIIILAVSHEFSHGVIGESEGIKAKTTGVGLFLLFPLAFVEPDEKSYKKASKISKIRMLCAGSFANFIVSLLATLIIIYLFTPIISNLVTYDQVIINSVEIGMPANIANITDNSTLISINNESIFNQTQFYEILLTINPNQTILVETDKGFFNLTTTSRSDNESQAYLGVITTQDWSFKEEWKNYPLWLLSIPLILVQLLMWISNINFSVGVFNLFPLWITDGGKIIYEIFGTFIKDNKKLNIVASLIFYLCLSILLFNMFWPLFS